jgi:hydrogenase maturation protease
MPTTCVLGIGNVLMSDDGWGPRVANAFDTEYVVGSDVEVLDLGTPGLDLTPWLLDTPRVILLDTVHADAPPGTVRLYNKQDVVRHRPGPRVGPHDPGVKEALLGLEFAGRGPRVLTLVGVVPERLTPGLQLSPAVAQAIEPAVELVAAQLRRWGLPVQRRIAQPAFRKIGTTRQNPQIFG